MQETETKHASQRYLTLTLAGETFAIGIDAVREILDYTEITRIPQAPAFMRGVVNVRGNAVPVVDLGQKLGLGEVGHTIHTRIVIMEVARDGETAVMGALADSVKEVLELASEAIVPPPRMASDADASCLRGIGRQDDRFILLLDVDRIFATDALYDMSSLLTGQAAQADASAAA